jgi:putative transposase
MQIDYNNLYIHFVLTTLNRLPYIEKLNRVRIEKYITGITNKNGSRLYAIYANPEHVHLLVSKSPQISENHFVDLVASSSAKFINENKLVQGRFSWQSSASAFSISKSEVNKVCKYILNQPVHHRKITFQEEYDRFMQYYQQKLGSVK